MSRDLEGIRGPCLEQTTDKPIIAMKNPTYPTDVSSDVRGERRND